MEQYGNSHTYMVIMFYKGENFAPVMEEKPPEDLQYFSKAVFGCHLSVDREKRVVIILSISM